MWSDIPHALIGAAALAIHGVSRATADVDLLTVDGGVLDSTTWASVEALRLVKGHEIVDVIVGKFDWQREIIETAEPLSIGSLTLPVAHPAGLILLKLHAGGPKDAWDVESLLEILERTELENAVDHQLTRLPAEARRLWQRLRSAD